MRGGGEIRRLSFSFWANRTSIRGVCFPRVTVQNWRRKKLQLFSFTPLQGNGIFDILCAVDPAWGWQTRTKTDKDKDNEED